MELREGLLFKKEVAKETLDLAIKSLGLTELDFLFEKPEDRQDIQMKVGILLQNYIVGRCEPKRSKPSKGGECLKMIPRDINHIFHSYPKFIKNDNQKYKHLRKQYEQGEIEQNVYRELLSVLSVSKSKLKSDPVLSQPIHNPLDNLFGGL